MKTIKKYTITETTDKKNVTLERLNEGFNTTELIGILTLISNEILFLWSNHLKDDLNEIKSKYTDDEITIIRKKNKK